MYDAAAAGSRRGTQVAVNGRLPVFSNGSYAFSLKKKYSPEMEGRKITWISCASEQWRLSC